MSVAPRPPPILRLSADVFVHILKINANIFTANEDALNTTRFSSQVCRSWRSIILNTPLLWGRIINIDHLKHLRSTHWVEEIMLRSGDAPLWIVGQCERPRGYQLVHKQRIFFNNLIEHNWDRIQRLFLSGPILDGIDCLNGALYRPAPKLQVFHVRFSDNNRDLTTDTRHRSAVLFSGSAPMLRHFSTGHRNIDLSNAPWSRNLDSITLGHPYDIPGYLKLLSATHMLQYLEIRGTNTELSCLCHPVVSLPRLKYLKVTLHYGQIIFFLDHLEVPHGCVLDLFTYSHPSDGIKLPQILSTLSTASQRYFKSRPPKRINITCEGSELVIVREDFLDDFNRKDCIFRILCRSFDKSPDYMPSISQSLSLPEFGGVTELKLRYSVGPPAVPDLSFLRYFSSVEILHANEQLFKFLLTALNHLPYSYGRHTLAFPKLRHVILQEGSSPYLEPCTMSDDTVKFILSRIETGHAISVLDLTACKECEMDYAAIDRLDGISGLQVILKRRA